MCEGAAEPLLAVVLSTLCGNKWSRDSLSAKGILTSSLALSLSVPRLSGLWQPTHHPPRGMAQQRVGAEAQHHVAHESDEEADEMALGGMFPVRQLDGVWLSRRVTLY